MQKLANLRQIGIFCFILAIPASKSSVGSRGGRMCFPWFTLSRTRTGECFSSALLHKLPLSAVLLRIASCRTRVEVCRYPHFYTLFAVSRLSTPTFLPPTKGACSVLSPKAKKIKGWKFRAGGKFFRTGGKILRAGGKILRAGEKNTETPCLITAVCRQSKHLPQTTDSLWPFCRRYPRK